METPAVAHGTARWSRVAEFVRAADDGDQSSAGTRCLDLRDGLDVLLSSRTGAAPLPGSIAVIRILDALFVGPTPAIAAPPYHAPNKPTRDRSPRDNDRPEVPGTGPR
jgi:hypothetical protein